MALSSVGAKSLIATGLVLVNSVGPLQYWLFLGVMPCAAGFHDYLSVEALKHNVNDDTNTRKLTNSY